MNTQATPPAERLLKPIKAFAEMEISGGVVLLACALIAMIWANSPWAESYFHLWEIELTIRVGDYHLTRALHHWINDGLMAMFFFVVGLEIKREVLVGELSTFKQAILPVAAAIGGMVVPAGVYATLHWGEPTVRGWGIPMATDIAFALGVLALLGKRVPVAIKIFLAGLAIADDIGAVLAIAFFYTSKIIWMDLLFGGGFLLALILGNWAGVRSSYYYAVLGIGGVWLAFLLSGVHPTIAGVLAALTIPARTRIPAREFSGQGRELLAQFDQSCKPGDRILANQEMMHAINGLEGICEQAQTPLQRLEHGLMPLVTYLVMPLFALANAGVTMEGNLGKSVMQPVSLGIFLGLVVGKPIGIFLFSFIAVKSRLAALPRGVGLRQIFGVGLLGGIGFTMSLFIAGLAFPDAANLYSAKIGILIASLTAGILGSLMLSLGSPIHRRRPDK
jgi:NhaA family Na+:H+ antiporter